MVVGDVVDELPFSDTKKSSCIAATIDFYVLHELLE